MKGDQAKGRGPETSTMPKKDVVRALLCASVPGKNPSFRKLAWKHLRQGAEPVLDHKFTPAAPPGTKQETQPLERHLSVYEIQPETQKEQLRNRQRETAGSREAYFDHYDAAPLKSARGETADALRLAAAVNKSEAMVITDAAWIVQYANSAFYHLTGYQSDEVIGKDMTFLRLKEDGSVHQRAESDSTPKALRHVLLAKDRMLRVESFISTFRDNSGAITNFLLQWRAIEKQPSAQEQLRNSEKTQTTGGIPHSFKKVVSLIIDKVREHISNNGRSR